MGKKILSLCMALVLCLSQLPVTALAGGEHDSHSNGWTELTADTTTLSGGSYYLSGDVECTGTESITVSGEVILCLNGQKLDLKGPHISVGSSASLTLCDCSTGGVLTGGSGSNGGGVYVGGGGTFTMTGGSIAGNTANAGGGVYVPLPCPAAPLPAMPLTTKLTVPAAGCVYTAPFICPVMSSFKAIRRMVALITCI